MEDMNPNQLWVENSTLDARLGICGWECENSFHPKLVESADAKPVRTRAPVFTDKTCASGAVQFKPVLFQGSGTSVTWECSVGQSCPRRRGRDGDQVRGASSEASPVRGEEGKGKPTVVGA